MHRGPVSRTGWCGVPAGLRVRAWVAGLLMAFAHADRGCRMIARATKVQLLVFALVTLVTVSILSAQYVGLTDTIMGGTYLVSADFADSGGIFQGSEATYRGVTVGKVEALQLKKGGVLVQVRFNRGIQIPKNTLAVVENRSAVGEQYIDFQPRTSHGPMLTAGSVVPRVDTRSPVRIDNLLLHLNQTVQSVDRTQLGTVVDELGTAFAGGGTDLQRLLDSGDALTKAATQALPQTIKLIDDGKIVLDTQQATSGNIKDLSRNFADLSETLQGSDTDLRLVLDRGVVASTELNGHSAHELHHDRSGHHSPHQRNRTAPDHLSRRCDRRLHRGSRRRDRAFRLGPQRQRPQGLHGWLRRHPADRPGPDQEPAAPQHRRTLHLATGFLVVGPWCAERSVRHSSGFDRNRFVVPAGDGWDTGPSGRPGCHQRRRAHSACDHHADRTIGCYRPVPVDLAHDRSDSMKNPVTTANIRQLSAWITPTVALTVAVLLLVASAVIGVTKV